MRSGAHFVFDLDIRDYNLWLAEADPVFLVLFDATRRRAYWLYVQRYFENDGSRQPRKGVKTVRVEVPGPQAISNRGVARMRQWKEEATS